MDAKESFSKVIKKIKDGVAVIQEWRQRLPMLNGHAFTEGLIGIDFGPEFLKLLQISSSESKIKVENYSIMPVPSGAVVKDEIKEFAVVSTILKDMFRQTGITTKDVALAIPRSLAIIKNITVDSRLNKDEIESRAWIEASRHFPDLIGDIYLDFAVIGPSTQDNTQLELILVACRKEQIKPYLEVLRLAGLNPKIVDVNSYALERALALAADNHDANSTVALLNLNTNLSTFIVVYGNTLVHAHDQTFDGHRLQTQVSNYIKDKLSGNEDGNAEGFNDVNYTNILKENLLSHLRHAVHFFYSSRPNIAIQQMIISGDCASIPKLASFIQGEINIETIVANPFKNMVVASHLKEVDLQKKAPALMLSCGLALSKVEKI
jgi:type IV pilus assembly protein PilM